MMSTMSALVSHGRIPPLFPHRGVVGGSWVSVWFPLLLLVLEAHCGLGQQPLTPPPAPRYTIDDVTPSPQLKSLPPIDLPIFTPPPLLTTQDAGWSSIFDPRLTWPEYPWSDVNGRPTPGISPDVTTVTIDNTTVGLCRDKHFCSSLGCGRSVGTPFCYCDQECVFYDDCCYDYTSTCGHTAAPPTDHIRIELQSFSCVSIDKRSSTGYHMVSACPSDYDSGSQTAVRCANPDSADVLATVPCYGRGNGFHYRNFYCAICHGEELGDLLAWEVAVMCEDGWDNSRATQLLKESMGNFSRVEKETSCFVTMEVPSGDNEIDVSPPRGCYPDVKRHCSTTNDPLSDACDSYTALTNVDESLNVIFKNPHCALCSLLNGPDRIEFATDCDGFVTDMPVFYLTGIYERGYGGYDGQQVGQGPLIAPISILFDFRSDSSVKVVQMGYVVATETVRCPENEVYDPFVSRCRRLSCLNGYVLQGNRCVPDFTSLWQTCGDDDDIEIGVTVGVGVQCKNGVAENEDAHLPASIGNCLAEFIGLDEGTLQGIPSPTPSPGPTDCQGVTRFSYSGRTRTDSMRNMQDLEELTLQDSPLCEMFDSNLSWSVELTQHCTHLSVEKCDGVWLNETDFSLLTENGMTLIYVNASETWYSLNQTIIRDNFKRRESSLDRFTEVQICAEPTLTCPLVLLNSSLFEDDENNPGSIVYAPEGNVFSRDEYVRTENGEIQVCSFLEKNGTRNDTTLAPFFDFSPSQQVLSLIGNIVSMVASVITFITYCVFKELRQRVSLAIMALVACLFSAQLLLLVSGSATANPSACTAVAALGHFFWLSTVFWMGVLAFDLNRTFASVSKIRRLESGKQVTLLQSLFAFGTSFLIVLPCLIIHLCDCTDVPLSYGNENVCWIGNGYVNLVAFGAPIGVTVVVNGFLFGFTIRGIRTTKKNTKELTQSDKSEHQRMREELFIYIKISSLMGFTWIFGFAAALSDVIVLWYIFIILNSCQGLLIFLSFICNKKVWRLWRALWRARSRAPPSGSGTYTPSSKAMLKHSSGSGDSKFNRTRCTQV